MEAGDREVDQTPLMRRRISPLNLMWLASPLAYPALYLSAPLLPETIRVLLGAPLLYLLPGWVLHLLVLPRSTIGLAARLTRAFGLSVFIFSAVALVGWFFGGDVGLGPVPDPGTSPFVLGRLSTLIWALAGVVFVLALLLLVRDLRNARSVRRREAEERAVAASTLPGFEISGADERGPGTARGKPTGARSGGEPEGNAPDAASAGAASMGAASAGADDPTQADLFLAQQQVNPVMQRIMREAYRLGDQHKKDHPVAPRWATLLVLGVLVASASALGFYAGGMFGFDTDALDHVSSLREMVERDRILPRTTFYIDGDGAAVDARKGFFHVLFAVQAVLCHTSVLHLWDLLPGLLMPLALVVFHSFARRLLRSEGSALFATFLAFVFFGEINRGTFLRLGYGSQMGFVLAWATLAGSLEYILRIGRRKVLIVVALAAFGATATHIFAAVYVLFSLGVFFLAMLLFRPWRSEGVRRVGQSILAVSAGCAIPLIWRYLFTYETLNPIHTHPHGILSFTENLYILMPDHWKRFPSVAGFGGVFLSLFLWRRAREDDAVLYMAALSLAPVLIVFNPLLVPLLEPYLGYLVARFVWAIPFLMVFAHMARRMGENLLELHSARRVVTSLLFYVFMVVLLFPRLEGFAHSYARANLERREDRSSLAWKPLLEKLEDTVTGPAVVLSDPVTGYSIPAFTSLYTVSVLHQHGSPSDSLALERLAACRDVLSPYRGAGEKARLCHRFDVDYVLVNGDLPAPVHHFFCNASPRLAEIAFASLAGEPNLFELVWEDGQRNRSALFRVRRENVDALSGIVRAGQARVSGRTSQELTRSILVRNLPEDVIPVPSDTLAGIVLTAVDLDTTLVHRGDSVGVTLYWRRVGEPPQFPVNVHLRMDTPTPRGPLWSVSFSKLHRRWQEKRLDMTFRYRQIHRPLDGLLGIEHWPTDWFVVDHLQLEVPEYSAPGEYAFKVMWQERPFLINWPVTYYFDDRDIYDGETVGYLEVF